jgi:hypothetical protein
MWYSSSTNNTNWCKGQRWRRNQNIYLFRGLTFNFQLSLSTLHHFIYYITRQSSKMPPKSILKKTSKPIPGTRTASGKRVRPGQNLRKAAAAEKESEKTKGAGGGKGKGRFDKKLVKGGKYEKYLGPGEYTGPTGGNAGPLGAPGAAKADSKGKGNGKDVKGKGKKTVTLAVKKTQEDEDGDVEMSDGDGNDFGDEDGSGSEGSEAGTDEELGKKSSKSNGNSESPLPSLVHNHYVPIDPYPSLLSSHYPREACSWEFENLLSKRIIAVADIRGQS